MDAAVRLGRTASNKPVCMGCNLLLDRFIASSGVAYWGCGNRPSKQAKSQAAKNCIIMLSEALKDVIDEHYDKWVKKDLKKHPPSPKRKAAKATPATKRSTSKKSPARKSSASDDDYKPTSGTGKRRRSTTASAETPAPRKASRKIVDDEAEEVNSDDSF
jgi:hypothetical protein